MMAVKQHMAELLDRLVEGKPGAQDWQFSFGKIKDAQVVAYKGPYAGGHVEIYVKFGGQWFAGPQLYDFPPSAGKLLTRGRSPADQARHDARERERQERSADEERAQRNRAALNAQINAVRHEIDQIKLTGDDRERLTELIRQRRDLEAEQRRTGGIWYEPAELPPPGPGEAYPNVEVL
jgi:hypothetical protein